MQKVQKVLPARLLAALATLFLFTFANPFERADCMEQAHAPMRAQAQRAAARPMKLDVRPLTQVALVGGTVSAQVSMLDASNEPAAWRDRESKIEVEINGGTPQKQTLIIPAGQSAAGFTFKATQSGVISLTARDMANTLLSGGNSVYVRADTNKKAHRSRKQSILTFPERQEERSLFQTVSFAAGASPNAGLSTWTYQGGTSSRPASSQTHSLLLTNGKDEVLADGKDFARIKVYFMDTNGGAPSDIKIWLTWTNGDLSPQPIVIKKGESSAEAHWVSQSPVDHATVAFVTAGPRYTLERDTELKVSFVPPIYGVGYTGPNPLRMSLIDCEPLTAQFFDQQGRTVQTNKPRRINFISTAPALHLDPVAFDVQPNQSGGSIFVLPTWKGRSNVDIWTPGYDHQTVVVEVTVWLVLVLCLLGGVVGGIAAKDKLKGSIAWRAFVGIVGSIVLVWLCVFAVLPKTHSVVAHNLVSVLVVGLIGGYLGTQALDIAAKRLPIGS
jgi:hypothetical protein